VAQSLVGGIAVDHRIHIAAGHPEEKLGLAQCGKRFGALPIGLRDDADAKTLRFQQAADHRHAETRMIDVGVARHQHDVAGVPPQQVHLVARHRQERRVAEALRPVLAVGKQGFGVAHARGVGQVGWRVNACRARSLHGPHQIDSTPARRLGLLPP